MVISAQFVRFWFSDTSILAVKFGLIVQMTGMAVTIVVGQMTFYLSQKELLFCIKNLDDTGNILKQFHLNVSYKNLHAFAFWCCTHFYLPIWYMLITDKAIFKRLLDIIGYLYPITIRAVMIIFVANGIVIIRDRLVMMETHLEKLLNDNDTDYKIFR